jgi:origin recognition complex subunit 1
VPIYSREFFNDQFQPTKSVVKGWTYIRQGVYWCDKAFDKGAKGGKVYSVDLDEWRESGKVGGGWKVELKELEPEPEPEPEVDEEDDSEEEAEIAEGEDEVEDEDVEMGAGTPRKRKTVSVKSKTSNPTTPRKKQKTSTATAQTKSGSRAKTVTKGSKKKVPHPKSSTSNLPATILPENLPKNPYERALRLLHVGATPDSLPCREEEFVDVLSRVEEGVEGGGGGCLCTSSHSWA